MDETRERVREWDSRPVDGVEGVARLAEREFTGALVDGEDVLFLLNGRAVGTTGKPAEAFDGGRAHGAPGPALPLLFAMVENGGETKTQGYTNDTPLREVDRTLQDSKFTGYVELSENVHSGDYYMVYYGGRALYAAFVGSRDETLVGEEALERADDEVGIYEVVDASVEVSDLPEPEPEPEPEPDSDPETAAAGAGTGASAAADDGEADADRADEPEPETDDAGGETAMGAVTIDAGPEESESEPEASEPEATPEAEESDTDDVDGPGADGTDAAEGEPTDAGDPPEPAGAESEDAEPEASERTEPDKPEPTDAEPGAPEAGPDEGDRADRDESSESPDPASESPGVGPEGKAEPAASPEPDEPTEPDGPTGSDASTPAESAEPDEPAGGGPAANGAEPPEAVPGDDVFDAEEEWRETTSIPALDPDEAEDGGPTPGVPAEPADDEDEERSSASGEAEEPSPGERHEREGREGRRARDSESERRRLRETLRERTEALTERTEQLEAARERVDELESELSETESELEETRAEREELDANAEELRAERERLREEREDLKARVDELEASLREAREQAEPEPEKEPGVELDAARALGGTNLFVRYGSKSEPTLEAITEGAERAAVRANLQLNEHTTFEAEGATVGGQPFESFLEDSAEYAFVEWVVTELPFEIRETGHEAGLSELYEALPEVDRAELHGTVEVEDEDGTTGTHDFDVVLRNRMGEPLVVADINAEREPVDGAMMADLVESADAVAAAEDIGAALYVTASFFEPDALERAEADPGGGLLSRSNKENYVKVERKRGYHLCLVESREGSFYVTLPEL
jgi:hypothetical protein